MLNKKLGKLEKFNKHSHKNSLWNKLFSKGLIEPKIKSKVGIISKKKAKK